MLVYGQQTQLMKIAYLVHNLNDPAVERRCIMLERGGAQVKLAGFCRDETLTLPIAARQPMVLGVSRDAAFAARALSTLQSAIFNSAIRTFFAECHIIMARNLEQLAIASAIADDRPLVFECLDIHRSLVGKSLPAKLVQAVEGSLLPRVDLLITSSPAFVDNHFAQSRLDSPIMLLENKLLVDDADQFAIESQPPTEGAIRIGWFGMLRCAKTLEVLTAIAKNAPGKIEVLIAGKPSPAVFPDFESAVRDLSGITFVGPYRYGDLPRLYGRCHFAWTIDWFEEGENSSWLLPNRIYEAVAYGCVPIALSHIEVGRWLAKRRAGLLVEDYKDVLPTLMGMGPDKLAAYQRAIADIAVREVLADDADCVSLVNRLCRVRRR